ncbi:MAG: hypothetical protein AB7G17_05880 [Phycisphaerales bacterium]
MADAAVGWIDAESSLLLNKAGRAAARLALLVVAAIVGAGAACGLLVAGGMLLARELGPVPAVLIISGIALIAASTLAWFALRSLKRLRASPEAAARERAAREQLKELLPGDDDNQSEKQERRGFDPADLLADAGKAVARSLSDPKLLTGSIFAVVSVLGVGRTLRLVRTAAGALSSIAIVTDMLNLSDHASRNGTPPTGGGIPPKSRPPGPTPQTPMAQPTHPSPTQERT